MPGGWSGTGSASLRTRRRPAAVPAEPRGGLDQHRCPCPAHHRRHALGRGAEAEAAERQPGRHAPPCRQGPTLGARALRRVRRRHDDRAPRLVLLLGAAREGHLHGLARPRRGRARGARARRPRRHPCRQRGTARLLRGRVPPRTGAAEAAAIHRRATAAPGACRAAARHRPLPRLHRLRRRGRPMPSAAGSPASRSGSARWRCGSGDWCQTTRPRSTRTCRTSTDARCPTLPAFSPTRRNGRAPSRRSVR